jgi:hypothetical protein
VSIPKSFAVKIGDWIDVGNFFEYESRVYNVSVTPNTGAGEKCDPISSNFMVC